MIIVEGKEGENIEKALKKYISREDSPSFRLI